MNANDRKYVELVRYELGSHLNSRFTDFDFLRWLQGYDYNLSVIIPKLRHHIAFVNSFDWKDYQLDDVMVKFWPSGLLGPSGVDNNIIYIECSGRLDGEGVLKSINMAKVVKGIMSIMERIMQRLHEQEVMTGEQWALTHIVDVEHFILDEKQWALARGPFRLLVRFFMEHCVEVLQKIIVVNAHSYMYYFFRAIKLFMPEKTRRKIIILGPDWKNVILKHVKADRLPKYWGGNMTDEKTGDEYCSSVINVPPLKVDPSYFWKRGDNTPKLEDLATIIINAWKLECINVKVDKPSTRISWYFWSSGDFGFGIFFTEINRSLTHDSLMRVGLNDLTMVYPYVDRLPGPNIVPEEDSLLCKKAGYYKLVFSNTFSWLSSLRISYQIKVD